MMKSIQVVKIQMIKESRMKYEFASSQIISPNVCVGIFEKFIGLADREHSVMMCLDTKNKVISLITLSIGTLNVGLVHPREVFKSAILSNAASIILGHNHPSGDPEPSPEDIQMTERIAEAGRILGIELLDHIIIGDEGRFVSMKEKGFM
jgi:DNA repair protein RadC